MTEMYCRSCEKLRMPFYGMSIPEPHLVVAMCEEGHTVMIGTSEYRRYQPTDEGEWDEPLASILEE